MAIDGAFATAVFLLANVLSSMNVVAAHMAVKIPPKCEQVVFSIMYCTSYMIAGSNLTKPDSRCCPGIQEVVDAGKECLCPSLLLEQKMGFKLDMTRALGLQKLCRIKNDQRVVDCVATSPSPSSSSPMAENAPPPAPTSPATFPGAPPAEAPKSSSVPSPSAPPVLPTPTSPGPAGAKAPAPPGPQVNPADSGAGNVSIPVMAILVAFAVAVLSHLKY